MHSGMGVRSEKWPWPVVECGHPHIWIANSAVYRTPPRTAFENATTAPVVGLVFLLPKSLRLFIYIVRGSHAS